MLILLLSLRIALCCANLQIISPINNRINFMYKIIFVILFGLSSILAFASPNQLDILGLVPGVSELSQVQNAADPNFKSEKIVKLEIGGHKIPCAVSFLNGKLAHLSCTTGKGRGGIAWTEASNTEVHADLAAGFTKKFGIPNAIDKMPMRTRMGVTYENNIIGWKDKRGNQLYLYPMADIVDQGLITLSSFEYLQQEAGSKAENEARKKF